MKKIKLITLILIIVLLSLISFGGLYLKTDYKLENVVPEYKFGRNLSASRVIEIIPDETVNTVIKDAEGNIVEEAGENTVTEEVPVNSEDILNKENFETTKKIVTKRLEQIGVQDHNIRLNEENGKIVIEIEDGEVADAASVYASQKAHFSIIDEKTEEVLMDNSYIEAVDARYATNQTSDAYGTNVFLNIKFNEDGAKRLEEISNVYVKSTDEEGNDTTKKINIQVDGQVLITTYFTEKIKNGTIQLTVGNTSTDSEELQEYLTNANYMAALLNNGELPINYITDSDQYISANVKLDSIALYILIALITLIFILMVAKYKGSGIIGFISVIGYVAVLLLTLRYTDVIITLEGIVGIIFATILDMVFVKALLKEMKKEKNIKEIIKENYIKYFVYIIPVSIIMAVTFSFIEVATIASLGMTTFWGIILIALYNIVITRTMFVIAKSK